jgi:hypothetical protein
MCWFLDAGNDSGASYSGGRRTKSAKTRSRRRCGIRPGRAVTGHSSRRAALNAPQARRRPVLNEDAQLKYSNANA